MFKLNDYFVESHDVINLTNLKIKSNDPFQYRLVVKLAGHFPKLTEKTYSLKQRHFVVSVIVQIGGFTAWLWLPLDSPRHRVLK